MDADLPGSGRPVQAGDLLGDRYQLVDPVGTGGMAVVWKAWDVVLARTVAVKLLRHAGDPESRARIRREARAAAALAHPNIAQVYDYGEAAGGRVPYVVLELVRGGTLLDRLGAGEVPARFALRVCAEVGAALAAAHAEGLVHRDIKPANIMLAPTGVKVVDFGIAAAAGLGVPDEEVYGTPSYIAPERLTDGAVAPASDVYALGVLLYRLLAGHTPWPDQNTTQLLAAHIHEAPPPLVPRTAVADEVLALCARCLSKDPAGRPSAREATRVLARAAGLEVVEDEPAPAPSVGVPAAEPSMVVRAPARAPQPTTAPAPQLTAAPAPEAAAAPAPQPIAARGRRRLTAAGAIAVAVAAGAGAAWVLLPRVAAPAPAGPAALGSPPAFSVVPSARPSARTHTSPPAATGTPTATATTTAIAGPGRGSAASTSAAAPPPVTTTTAGPVERTLSSAAGTVTATCPAATTAQIVSWAATKPYKLEDVDTNAGPAPAATFRHGNDHVTMTVTCKAGVPSATVS